MSSKEGAPSGTWNEPLVRLTSAGAQESRFDRSDDEGGHLRASQVVVRAIPCKFTLTTADRDVGQPTRLGDRRVGGLLHSASHDPMQIVHGGRCRV